MESSMGGFLFLGNETVGEGVEIIQKILWWKRVFLIKESFASMLRVDTSRFLSKLELWTTFELFLILLFLNIEWNFP